MLMQEGDRRQTETTQPRDIMETCKQYWIGYSTTCTLLTLQKYLIQPITKKCSSALLCSLASKLLAINSLHNHLDYSQKINIIFLKLMGVVGTFLHPMPFSSTVDIRSNHHHHGHFRVKTNLTYLCFFLHASGNSKLYVPLTQHKKLSEAYSFIFCEHTNI